MDSPKNPEKNYYAILDVPMDAPANLIKKNYRLLAQRYHPDRYTVPEEAAEATLRMIEINRAFAVLSDKGRRAEYDDLRTAASRPPTTFTPKVQWEVHQTPTGPQAAVVNPAVDDAVSEQFLRDLKKVVSQRSSEMKLREEVEKSCLWSFSGGNWNNRYWVSLARLPVLNINAVRTKLAELTQVTKRRRSVWKKSFFVFILAAESIADGEGALKICRSYCNEKENSTRGTSVNIVVLDVNRRRSIVCGKRPKDQNQQILLDTLVTG